MESNQSVHNQVPTGAKAANESDPGQCRLFLRRRISSAPLPKSTFISENKNATKWVEDASDCECLFCYSLGSLRMGRIAGGHRCDVGQVKALALSCLSLPFSIGWRKKKRSFLFFSSPPLTNFPLCPSRLGRKRYEVADFLEVKPRTLSLSIRWGANFHFRPSSFCNDSRESRIARIPSRWLIWILTSSR